MELVLAMVPFLAVLACPLMMLLCVVGVHRMGRGASQVGTTAPVGSGHERVAMLHQQLRAIQAELTALKATPPASDGARETNGRSVGAISEGARAARRHA